MNAYFVLGIITAVWAVGLTAYGLTREDFPSSKGQLRAAIAITLLLVLGTLAALMATTHKEHPREEAEEKAAEAAAEKAGEGGKISALENEYNIDLDVGDTLTPGEYTFEVDNQGRIDHDLAVEGDGVEEQTELIKPGGKASLTVDLEAGSYNVYCTVPGHEEQGMQVDLSVE